jgi:hypothetical protein
VTWCSIQIVKVHKTLVLMHKNANKPVAVDKNFGERYCLCQQILSDLGTIQTL